MAPARSGSGEKRRPPPPITRTRAWSRTGSQVYADHCALCHGANLEGQPNWMKHLPDGKLPAPPHDPSGHTWHHSDGRLFLIVKEGLGEDYPTDMPLYKDLLSGHDIWATLAFIKSTWPEEIRAKQPRPRPSSN